MGFVPKAAIRMVNREKGRKGGIATAQKHSKEWLQERATKAGNNTRDLYGSDFYRYINAQRSVRRGWPKGKPRKIPSNVEEAIKKLDLCQTHQIIINNVLEGL